MTANGYGFRGVRGKTTFHLITVILHYSMYIQKYWSVHFEQMTLMMYELCQQNIL